MKATEKQVVSEEAAAEQAYQGKLAQERSTQLGRSVSAETPHGQGVNPAGPLPVAGTTKGVAHDFAGRPVDHQRAPVPVKEDAEGWPVSSATAGDQEAVTEAITAMRRVSDVGSCAALLSAVVGHCRAMRVRPEVVRDAVKG